MVGNYGTGSDSGFAFFIGADANGLLNVGNENLPITDFSGFGRLDDRGDGAIQLLVTEDNFDFDLRQEIDSIFAAAIDFRVTFLPTEPLHFADGHTFNT